MAGRRYPAVETRPSWVRTNAFWLSGSAALVLAVLVGFVVVLRQQAALLGLDEEWAEEMLEFRGPVGHAFALVFDIVGGHLIGSILIPVGGATALFLFRRRWAAFYYLLATAISAGLVQVLKHAFARARPEDMLVTSDFGSFPSGHVANAATLAVTVSLIFPYVWVWIAGAAWTILMALSRTYLGAHWMTDTIGGMLIGAGVALLLWGPFAVRVRAERTKPVPGRPVSSAADAGR
ncbi:phosphatase PAP2 family protein [Rathayibacter sp. YIM 133350]|uniref:phosphatase PAP2 family protein n=1 Tax=Rathayibacter sp. YIM 133350 TaxID=3131992 RepID=UPI00307EDC48